MQHHDTQQNCILTSSVLLCHLASLSSVSCTLFIVRHLFWCFSIKDMWHCNRSQWFPQSTTPPCTHMFFGPSLASLTFICLSYLSLVYGPLYIPVLFVSINNAYFHQYIIILYPWSFKKKISDSIMDSFGLDLWQVIIEGTCQVSSIGLFQSDHCHSNDCYRLVLVRLVFSLLVACIYFVHIGHWARCIPSLHLLLCIEFRWKFCYIFNIQIWMDFRVPLILLTKFIHWFI